MSIRTIIEINHDYLHELEAMTIGEIMGAIDEAERHLRMPSMHGIDVLFGIKKLSSRHHSTDTSILLNNYLAYTTLDDKDSLSPDYDFIKTTDKS